MTVPRPLRPLLEEPEHSVLMLDFDGSLAPIVDDPATARPIPGAVEALERLARDFGTVAVVSGRPATFLQRVVPVRGVDLIGLYGLERVIDGTVVASAQALEWRDRLEAAADAAQARLPGLRLERKSGMSFALHWRTEPAREASALACATEVSREFGLHPPEHGRMTVEVRVPVDVDKGSVVDELATGARAAAFAGDDVGDLVAFRALARLRAERELGHAATIGVLSSEGPSGIAGADVVVEGPDGLTALLDELAATLPHSDLGA